MKEIKLIQKLQNNQTNAKFDDIKRYLKTQATKCIIRDRHTSNLENLAKN